MGHQRDDALAPTLLAGPEGHHSGGAAPPLSWRPAMCERTRGVLGGSGGCPFLARVEGYWSTLTHRQVPAGMGMVTGWRLTNGQPKRMTY
jgi:hypothetical protein